MNEATDLLAAQGVVHAAIDLDMLGVAHLPTAASPESSSSGSGSPNANASVDDLMYANLAAVCSNYARAGVERLLIARALETRAELDRLRTAVRAARVVVCRVRAPVAAMEARVRGREAGIEQAKYVRRVAELEKLLDVAGLEDFSVRNDNRSVTDVAREVLQRADWI
jgi:hypothetical protein